MRELKKGDALSVRAIGGLWVVTLAWDFAAGDTARRKGLLGFAIEREELDGNGDVVERYYLRGIKRFRNKDEGLAAGTPVPTSEHPVQSFQWGDYTVKPATTYRYRVVPMYGKPKLLEPDDDAATTVRITTEPELGRAATNGSVVHDIYFNRGVAGSQAYARKFPDPPDETQPESAQMKWLSRGLFEALLAFIARAAGDDAQDYALRGMFYEFRYLPVGKALAGARKAGADVAIRYEAQTYREDNEAMIAKAAIKGICKPQKSRAGIRHNKFLVLLHKGKPIAVWTGSTNISAGGIFGHSNVGHAIQDPAIAERYLDYWTELAKPDITRAPLVASNLAVEPTPAPGSKPPANRILTLYSPRDPKENPPTLAWYRDVMGSAKRIVCMTFAFSLADVFRDVLLRRDDTLRYAVFDDPLPAPVEDAIDLVHNTVIAAGSKLGPGDLENFIGEKLTGFNSNQYIHDKFLLVDPLGSDPVVVTGSANFSPASQSANDENMLVIRGSERVADIYFGEFMRIFDHLYSRYIVAKLEADGRGDPDAGYLKDKAEDWVPGHFRPGRKDLRRRYFMGRD
jgi:hypothetical protein